MPNHLDKRIVALFLVAVIVAFMAYRTYWNTPAESPAQLETAPKTTGQEK